MRLRQWQKQCVNLALNKFQKKHNHFLCLATPGAGKTYMAAEVAAYLLQARMIDYVLCFSPSISISHSFQNTLENRLDARMDGLLGAKGIVITYQSMASLDQKFWRLLEESNVFVIFDEIHHCAGTCSDDANAWGEQIILQIQDKAAYTLALTGTPWRSDNTPIVLAEYLDPDNQIHCDYIYGLRDAIKDNVCRIPQIISIDNDGIEVKKELGETNSYENFAHLLSVSNISFQSVLTKEEIITQVLSTAHQKLLELQVQAPSAGGLVVASNIEHAKQILDILTHVIQTEATLVTCQTQDAASKIEQFTHTTTPWIVSVGMISEGTNIPRLQICCHLSRIKTELHFRQVLGRVLRKTGKYDNYGYLFMLAVPELIEYAQRVAEDIPNSYQTICLNTPLTVNDAKPNTDPLHMVAEELMGFTANPKNEIVEPLVDPLFEIGNPGITGKVTGDFSQTFSLFGFFRQEIIRIGLVNG